MSLFFRTVLFLVLFLTGITSPALARIVLGVTPAVMPGASDRALLSEFEAELTSRFGEPVVVRSFSSESLALDWLIRFRELDAALVSPALIRSLPAGTLLHLADLPPVVSVTHPGTGTDRQETMRRGFHALLGDERGRQFLARLGSVTQPAGAPKSPPPRLAKAAPATPPPPVPAPGKAESLAPQHPKPAPATPSKPATVASQPASAPPRPAEPPAPAAPSTRQPAARPPAGPEMGAPPPARNLPAPPPPTFPAAGETSAPKRSRLLLLAAVIILIGISLKIAVLMRQWRQQRALPAAPPVPPSAELLDLANTGEPPVESAMTQRTTSPEVAPEARPGQPSGPDMTAGAVEPASSDKSSTAKENPAPVRRTTSARARESIFPPAGEELVVEQGRLGKTKVPALFKRCADLPQPVVLRVRTGDKETCIHFAAGQICHASSRNWRIDEGSRQWSKLGYLMVRDGLLSEAQRDQALELIDRQPGLRFAEVLQKLGVLDMEGLRQVLIRQAKSTVYALILFSSGEYRIEADDGAIPAEESIALQVEALIREASHHQAEWLAIRKVLPNLGTCLDFTPEGREKLEQVRLSVHQQLLLKQVDGQSPLGTLCSESTMMDYEACRFLYLMVKAGVLQALPSA